MLYIKIAKIANTTRVTMAAGTPFRRVFDVDPSGFGIGKALGGGIGGGI
jgi:hypothetical protein